MQDLLLRVGNAMTVKQLYNDLEDANRRLDDLNKNLEQRVHDQVRELEQANRLRRFFSPQLAAHIISDHAEHILKEHRREVTIIFLDLRNFTPFAASASPAEVIATLRELHEAVGPILHRYGATLERFTGDGLMAFRGDPEPIPDHALQATRMAMEIREHTHALGQVWAHKGYDISLGMGIATGEASLGMLGFEGRRDYAAIGVATNPAARLCGHAEGGEIIISERTHQMIGDAIACEALPPLQLKGFTNPEAVFRVDS